MGVKRVTSQTELDSIAGPRFVVADALSGAWTVYTGGDMPRVEVPFSVTRRQFLEGCDRLGLLAAVMAWRSAVDTSTLAGRSQARWFDESLAFERSNVVLMSVAKTMGLADAQVDAAFVMMAGL